MRLYLSILLLFVLIGPNAQVTDTLNSIEWKGQMAGWMHYNNGNPYPGYIGGRFIPQANYSIDLNIGGRLDFEVSANLVGDVGLQIPDSSDWNGQVSPYRFWGRYSTDQLEVRLGLQKINFGSATLLRPLMWFDQVDPRDPLQLTDGVWGGLMRYYFLNNANLWVWVLYGNSNVKGWEYMKSYQSVPEFGGRIQAPVPLGEVALSYHHRVADSRHSNGEEARWDKIPESRLGIDARFDKVVGFWFEGAWVHMNKDMGELTNQVNLSLGMDYTFGIGNGLSIIAEHLVTSYDKVAFAFNDAINITACSLNYPIGMFDNMNTIVFYSWADRKWYNFINWSKQYNTLTINMMAYWNPDVYSMPLQGNAENLFGGKGIQLMLVYNF